jgi:RNA polymerase sigma-70 factor (ECF subfamily)
MDEERKILANLYLGDEKTFEFVFKNFFSGLCQFAFSIVRSKEVAEEIVEELFLYLWENSDNININNSLRSYLYRSVHNRCLKYIRHQQVEKKYLDNTPYIFTDEEIFGGILAEFPFDELTYNELVKNVDKALQNLPEQCREIFCMHRYDELSYMEIAQKLNLSINTVKTQMTRALQKMRDTLNDYISVWCVFLLLFF